MAQKRMEYILQLTRRRIRIVFGKVHGGSEITAIVERLGVKDDQADIPVEDVLVSELDRLACVLNTHVFWKYKESRGMDYDSRRY